jgi:hypothetical protein
MMKSWLLTACLALVGCNPGLSEKQNEEVHRIAVEEARHQRAAGYAVGYKVREKEELRRLELDAEETSIEVDRLLKAKR